MLVKDMHQALQQVEQDGFGFGPMSLSKSALVHFMRRLDMKNENSLRIIELGGGQSTLFLSALHQLGLLTMKVMTLEHEPAWVEQLKPRVHDDCVCVLPQSLKQITDEQWEQLFTDPVHALSLWKTIGEPVPESQYQLYTIHNAFYGEPFQALTDEMQIDALIIDGPHGNGRSLAFPLLSSAIGPGTLVLIDDFDHYPFLSDLARLFQYKELYREIAGGKRWVLVQIEKPLF